MDCVVAERDYKFDKFGNSWLITCDKKFIFAVQANKMGFAIRSANKQSYLIIIPVAGEIPNLDIESERYPFTARLQEAYKLLDDYLGKLDADLADVFVR